MGSPPNARLAPPGWGPYHFSIPKERALFSPALVSVLEADLHWLELGVEEGISLAWTIFSIRSEQIPGGYQRKGKCILDGLNGISMLSRKAEMRSLGGELASSFWVSSVWGSLRDRKTRFAVFVQARIWRRCSSRASEQASLRSPISLSRNPDRLIQHSWRYVMIPQTPGPHPGSQSFEVYPWTLHFKAASQVIRYTKIW